MPANSGMQYFVRFAVSLALIGALGPSAVDMYLASLPEMAREYQTSYARVQLTLTFFLLAMGLGQLVFGPLVDAFGRRRPLLAGLLVFSLSSVAAAWAPTIDTLLIARFIQGLGSALTLVVILSMVRDVTSGVQAAKIFALLMTIEGLAPVIAPALGGYIDAHYGWRAIMLVLALLGLLVMLNSFLVLKETLPVGQREPLRAATIMRTYLRIARDPQFMRPTLALSAVFFFLFAYIGGAAFVYQTYYGLLPARFGLVFGATGLAILLGAVGAGRLVGHYGLARLTQVGAGCMAVGALLVVVSTALTSSLYGVVSGMAIALFGLGIGETTLMSLVMSSQKRALGSTAALLGAFQLVLSSAATPVSGLVVGHGPLAWGLLLLGCAVLICLLTWHALRDGAADAASLVSH